VIAFFIYQKKKKSKEANKKASIRKEKDEVWRTIKEFGKSNINSAGGEIINQYVAKRTDIDYVSPHLSPFCRSNKRAEIDIRRLLNGKKKEDYNSKRDLYVVCFQTRNIKTNIVNPPEAFECEVVKIPVSKKEVKQKIVITRSLDFTKEMEWIAPLRSIEQKKIEKNEKLTKKIEEKERKRKEKKKNKKNKKQSS
jgi:hypothetical protein